ncbi:lipoyl(octanoyl) transferase LipB [Desulfosoma caldarium]|nr:lipoyl(octanoyl) transferase LipB [Desulfosoma caldarium]
MPRLWHLVDLGLFDYGLALRLQQACVEKRRLGILARDVLFLVEHPSVFTCGRQGGTEHLCVTQNFLKAQGISLFPVERGGSITYHGPGQLVAYPIVHLPSAGWKVVEWVTALEEIMIQTARRFGVKATRNPRNRGVWVGEKKLGSLGIAVRHGVSFHGLALNVTTSLEPFGWIRPCGLTDVAVTSLAVETQTVLSMTQVKEVFMDCAQSVLDVHFEPMDLSALHLDTGENLHAHA